MFLTVDRIWESFGSAGFSRKFTVFHPGCLFPLLGRYIMRIFCLIQVLAVSFFLILTPCHAKRAYMWTDEQGVAHISDQAPPKGVEATGFSTERDHPEADAGEAEYQEQAGSQPIEAGSRNKDQTGQKSDSNQADNTRQDAQKAPKSKYRDEASLSKDEKIRLLVLETSKEHASKLYNTASSDDERRRWKAELDKIHAEEKSILEVGNK
jgi:hypothetical protein